MGPTQPPGTDSPRPDNRVFHSWSEMSFEARCGGLDKLDQRRVSRCLPCGRAHQLTAASPAGGNPIASPPLALRHSAIGLPRVAGSLVVDVDDLHLSGGRVEDRLLEHPPLGVRHRQPAPTTVTRFNRGSASTSWTAAGRRRSRPGRARPATWRRGRRRPRRPGAPGCRGAGRTAAGSGRPPWSGPARAAGRPCGRPVGPSQPRHREPALAHQQHAPVRRRRHRGGEALGGRGAVVRRVEGQPGDERRAVRRPSRQATVSDTSRLAAPCRAATFSTQRPIAGGGTRTTGTRRTLPRTRLWRRTVGSPWLLAPAALVALLGLVSACGSCGPRVTADGRTRRPSPPAISRRRPPSVATVRTGDVDLDARVVLLPHRGRGRLHSSGGCADGPPPEHPPELHVGTTPRTFAFPSTAGSSAPTSDRRAIARAMPARWSTPVPVRKGDRYVIPAVVPAGAWDVDVFGRGGTGNDLIRDVPLGDPRRRHEAGRHGRRRSSSAAPSLGTADDGTEPDRAPERAGPEPAEARRAVRLTASGGEERQPRAPSSDPAGAPGTV